MIVKIKTSNNSSDLCFDSYIKRTENNHVLDLNTIRTTVDVENYDIETADINVEREKVYKEYSQKYYLLSMDISAGNHNDEALKEWNNLRLLMSYYDPNASIKITPINVEDRKYLVEHGREILYNATDDGFYGADQGMPWKIYLDPKKNEYNSEILKMIEDRVRSYFPEMTDEEIVDYLMAINYNGCGYAALANYIFESYVDRPEEFERKFGFPMYYIEGNNNYRSNVNLLLVDIYCNNFKNLASINPNIKEIKNFIKTPPWNQTDITYSYRGNSSRSEGTWIIDFYQILGHIECNNNVSFEPIKGILEKGTEIIYELLDDIENTSLDSDDFEKITTTINNGGIVCIGASNYALYEINNIGTREETVEPQLSGNDGHWITVIGVNEQGDYIVSSWGKKYLLDPSSLGSSFLAYEVKFNE